MFPDFGGRDCKLPLLSRVICRVCAVQAVFPFSVESMSTAFSGARVDSPSAPNPSRCVSLSRSVRQYHCTPCFEVCSIEDTFDVSRHFCVYCLIDDFFSLRFPNTFFAVFCIISKDLWRLCFVVSKCSAFHRHLKSGIISSKLSLLEFYIMQHAWSALPLGSELN